VNPAGNVVGAGLGYGVQGTLLSVHPSVRLLDRDLKEIIRASKPLVLPNTGIREELVFRQISLRINQLPPTPCQSQP